MTEFAQALQLDELMIVTIVHDHAARLRSYSLLARIFDLHSANAARSSSAQL